MRRWPRLSRLVQGEEGTASVLPLLMLCALLVLGGFGIDSANLWRNAEVMRATADAAAHAGAVALARGSDPQDALALAEEAIGLNMDAAIFSPATGKPRSDLVRLWHYDAASGALSDEGTLNAVSVQIRRGPLDGNSLPLHVLDFLGLGRVTTATTSVVALAPSSHCGNAGGIFARGGLWLQGEAELDQGFCLHSQQEMRLDRDIKFEDGARLTMPDLARCEGFCSPDPDGGLAQASAEVNLISPAVRDHIGAMVTAMLGPLADSPAKAEFFATRPLDEDVEPLAELGLDVSNLATGSVVRLSAWDFEVLRQVPRGLVYAVFCDTATPEAPPILNVGGGASNAAVNDVVVLTNCALHFADDIEVMGALVISSYAGELPAITADPYAVPGDPSVTCDAAAATQIMSLGDQVLPSSLLLSNVVLAVDGNVTILPDEEGRLAQHHGFALHASGTVEVQGQHKFVACDQQSLATMPPLDVIRFVMPRIPAQPMVPMNIPDLPGERVKPLPSTPSLPMARRPDQLMSLADLPGDDVGL